jgi:hypothetical protein
VTDPSQETSDQRKQLATHLRELADQVELGVVTGMVIAGVGLLEGGHIFLDCDYATARRLQHNLTRMALDLSSQFLPGNEGEQLEIEVPFGGAN